MLIIKSRNWFWTMKTGHYSLFADMQLAPSVCDNYLKEKGLLALLILSRFWNSKSLVTRITYLLCPGAHLPRFRSVSVRFWSIHTIIKNFQGRGEMLLQAEDVSTLSFQWVYALLKNGYLQMIAYYVHWMVDDTVSQVSTKAVLFFHCIRMKNIWG